MTRVIEGIGRRDRKTKHLVKRLNPGDIAFVYHEDMDRVSAESLVKAGVAAVVNAYRFTTGSYPNQGPSILLDAGIHLIEDVGEEELDDIEEGLTYRIVDGSIYRGDTVVAAGYVLTREDVSRRMEEARENLDRELMKFADNTLDFIRKERKLLFEDLAIPELATRFENRSALVVVRGHDYEHDIEALRSFISEERPVVIGVDGGADALLERGIKPHVIIGDMDSVSDESLKSGAELVVHAYADGRAPGMARLRALGLAERAHVFPFAGTSEDAALVLAYEKGASLIVLVGGHVNLIDFLDKGRRGMASTFLTRLKVGDRLVDAKGVSRLYRSKASPYQLLLIAGGALAVFVAIVLASPGARALVRLLSIKIGLLLGL